MTVAVPENLEIPFIDGWASGDTAYIVWDTPEPCISLSEFNVYRNDDLIGSTTDTVYTDPDLLPAFYTYNVTAVYYFGESELSDPVYVLIVSVDENETNELIVSPNPALDFIQINSTIRVNSYSIMDNNGQLVESGVVESANFRLNVSQYSSGVYYLKLETDDKQILRKIILK